VVGAGLAGLYMLHRLRGLGLSTVAFEAGDGVGGTWYWNRYPGARCDVESLSYSYSFSEELEQEWEWTERYPTQPEILRYVNHVADRFDLRTHIQFETRVTSAVFDEDACRWMIATDRGDRVDAQFVVMATGCLSSWRIPDIEGMGAFRGATYHSGNWPHEPVDFTGLRVGVIGTGSSGIQIIPAVAEQAAHLYVFQRTPNFSVPAHNKPLDAEEQRRFKEGYREYRRLARESLGGLPVQPRDASPLDETPDARRKAYEEGWAAGGPGGLLSSYNNLVTDRDANNTAAEFVHTKIREIVKDPAVAELLCPTDHPIGTKRICVDIGYYETYNRDNVTLVDIRSHPIVSFTEAGIRTTDAEYALDAVVFATGFDAMTGTLNKIDIVGRSGRTLRDKWADGPRTYLGLQVAGFPNLFTITGPGSPSVLSNMMVSIEQHVDWIADLLAHLRDHDLAVVEASLGAEDAWVEHVNEVANYTLYPQADSWYVGANIPGKPRVFMPYIGGVGNYRAICDGVAANGYEGFVTAPA
jgi:cyclohexanone monooxygenase